MAEKREKKERNQKGDHLPRLRDPVPETRALEPRRSCRPLAVGA